MTGYTLYIPFLLLAILPPSSPSVICPCPVMQLQKTCPHLCSHLPPPLLDPSHYINPSALLPYSFSLSVASPSLPSLCLCESGHVVNNKGVQVAAAHRAESHGTLSLRLVLD